MFLKETCQDITKWLFGVKRCTINKNFYETIFDYTSMDLSLHLLERFSPSAIDSESIKPLSVLHSGLKHEW